jgi:hypothetical protein
MRRMLLRAAVAVLFLAGCVDTALPPELTRDHDAAIDPVTFPPGQGGSGPPDAAPVLPDAPPPAAVTMKISNLVVHDTFRAPGWAVQTNFQIGQAGAHPWSDYPNTYVASLDPGANILVGQEWLRVAANSKMYMGGPQATITLAATADVYMVVDDRWQGLIPIFTADWTDTGLNIQVWESTNRPALSFSLFLKKVPPGELALPPIGANTAYDYFIIVD